MSPPGHLLAALLGIPYALVPPQFPVRGPTVHRLFPWLGHEFLKSREELLFPTFIIRIYLLQILQELVDAHTVRLLC